jgi:hypothetical protein
MPNSSRNSMKNNIFNVLPDEQVFEGVSYEILSDVYERLLESTENNHKSLLVFDDVQSYLKTKEIEVNLLHIIANRSAAFDGIPDGKIKLFFGFELPIRTIRKI